MAVGLDVVVVRRIALQIHPPRVPVPLLRDTLRRPVRPYPELRVAEPLGYAVVLRQRLPGRLEGAGRDRTRGLRRDEGSECARVPQDGSARSSAGGRGFQEIASAESASHDVPSKTFLIHRLNAEKTAR